MIQQDYYVAVMPADEAIRVANLLANLGMILEGIELRIPEGDSYMLAVRPEDIHAAWKAVDTALHENWLGFTPGPQQVGHE
jgi:hypothetical protein